MTTQVAAKRGFAGMTPEQRTAIAKLGGAAAHAKGTAHEFTQDEAKAAGTKGGLATARKRAERRAAEQSK